ncbi:MAG: hypothetical protein KF716_08795 [Anaerolineae bacterium]|nr:hypothetical protein [Anaerolineae bacterium]
MSLDWITGSPEDVFSNGLAQYERTVYDALYQLALSFAPKIETWMKQNASWIDRTGNLRASLYAAVEELVNEIAIIIDYGLDYGVYLEFKNAGRYAIIGPALDHWSPLVWEAVKALLS